MAFHPKPPIHPLPSLPDASAPCDVIPPVSATNPAIRLRTSTSHLSDNGTKRHLSIRRPCESGANGCAIRSTALWWMPDDDDVSADLEPATLTNETPLPTGGRDRICARSPSPLRATIGGRRDVSSGSREKGVSSSAANPHAGRERPELRAGPAQLSPLGAT